MTILLPTEWPWQISDAYDESTIEQDVDHCNNCIWYGTNYCTPLMDWLYQSEYSEPPTMEFNILKLCNEYST